MNKENKLIPEYPIQMDKKLKIAIFTLILASLPYFINLFAYDGEMPYYKELSIASTGLLFLIIWFLGKKQLSRPIYISALAIFIAMIFVLGVFIGTEMSSLVYMFANLIALSYTLYLIGKHEKQRRHMRDQEVFQ